jgi:hypothetical protein
MCVMSNRTKWVDESNAVRGSLRRVGVVRWCKGRRIAFLKYESEKEQVPDRKGRDRDSERTHGYRREAGAAKNTTKIRDKPD